MVKALIIGFLVISIVVYLMDTIEPFDDVQRGGPMIGHPTREEGGRG